MPLFCHLGQFSLTSLSVCAGTPEEGSCHHNTYQPLPLCSQFPGNFLPPPLPRNCSPTASLGKPFLALRSQNPPSDDTPLCDPAPSVSQLPPGPNMTLSLFSSDPQTFLKHHSLSYCEWLGLSTAQSVARNWHTSFSDSPFWQQLLLSLLYMSKNLFFFPYGLSTFHS